MRRKLLPSLLAPLALASTMTIAHARILPVPSDFTEIQLAISAADPDSDDVIVITDHSAKPNGRYYAFTLNKAVPIVNTYGHEITVDAADTTAYAAKITVAGGSISGLTLQGGYDKVVDVGPGTVDNCRILDVAGTLVHDYAVEISGSYGTLTNSTVQRSTGPRTVRIGTGAAHCVITGCTIVDTLATSATENEVVHVLGPYADLEDNTILVKSSNQRFGVYLDGTGAGSAVLDNNFISGPEYGVRVYNPSTTPPVITYNVIDGAKYGIYFDDAAGATTIQHNTFTRGDGDLTHGVGIRLTSGISGGAVERNLIENVATGIVCNSATGVTYYHNIFSNADGGAATSSCSLTSTEIALKVALFCYGVDGTQPATQRIDSEAAPGNNGWNELVGAKDVECGWGTLSRDTTIKAGSPDVKILADLTVPYGKTLTIDDSNILRVDATDGFSGVPRVAAVTGTGTTHIDVAGGLVIAGSSGHLVGVYGSTSGEGIWNGLDANYATSLSVTYANITNAVYGILCPYDAACSITHSFFDNNSNIDISIGPESALAQDASYNVLDVGDSGVGIDLYSDYLSSVTISNNSMYGTADALVGMRDYSGVNDGAATISGNTIYGFTDGMGFRNKYADAVLTGNEIYDCKQGVYVDGGTPSIGTSSSSSDNALHGNTSGIYVSGSGAAPYIRNNEITGNTYGIQKASTSSPDAGTSGDHGNNTMTGNSTYCIWNRTGTSLTAVANYYGACSPSPPVCYYGPVDASSGLCSAPAGTGAGLAVVPDGGEQTLLKGAFPNPMRGSTVIGFVTVGGARSSDLAVFDLAGHLVRRFEDPGMAPGYHEVHWDGQDSDGRKVASGLYFIKLKSGSETAAYGRILVIR